MGFYVGGTGNVSVVPQHQEDAIAAGLITAANAAVLFTACPVGYTIRDFAISRIMATGTTATAIVLLGYGDI